MIVIALIGFSVIAESIRISMVNGVQMKIVEHF